MVERWPGVKSENYRAFLSTVGFELYRQISSDDIYVRADRKTSSP